MVKSIIIKSTYSMLQNGELKSNYGDLIRSLVILRCIGQNFAWATDKRGKCLMKYFIDNDKLLLLEDGPGKLLFSQEDYEIYCLDNYISDERWNKLPGKWHGFVPNGKLLEAENCQIKSTVPYIKKRPGIKKSKSYQQSLVEGLGFKWSEQDFPAPKINARKKYDIGLNWNVHPEWESKHWPKEYWKELEDILRKDYTVSWQQGLDNFYTYIKWLSSCRLIVTCDTLGLHLASALRKKVVAIVGPTENREFSYGRVHFIRPAKRECMPCEAPKCIKKSKCINEVCAQKASACVKDLLGKRG